MIDVLLKNQQFQQTPEAVILQKELKEIRLKEQILDAAYAGANLAALLIANPDVAKMNLELSPSYEYDDNGVNYRSIALHVLECFDINGQEIDFDNDKLEETLEDYREEIYNVIAGPYESYDVVIEMSRSSIQAMIDSGEVSGLQAIKCLLAEQFTHLAALESEQA